MFMHRHHPNQLPPFFSTYFTKHVQTRNYPTRNAEDYNINKTKKMFSDCAIRNFLEFFGKNCKTLQNNQTLQ